MTQAKDWNDTGRRTPDSSGREPWILNPSIQKEAKRFMYKGIAISGKMGSGKTTLANHLSKLYGLEVVHFAQAFKDEVAEALYLAGLDCPQDDIMRLYKGELRGLLQDWGSIFRKLNSPDHWVEALFKAHKGPVIIDDMRYANEFEACQARGFLTVRIEVTPEQQKARIGEQAGDPNHPSETGLDNFFSRFDWVAPDWLETGLEVLPRYWDDYVAKKFDIQRGAKK